MIKTLPNGGASYLEKLLNLTRQATTSQRRFASLNTAIHAGIRRSRSAGWRDESSTRRENSFPRRDRPAPFSYSSNEGSPGGFGFHHEPDAGVERRRTSTRSKPERRAFAGSRLRQSDPKFPRRVTQESRPERPRRDVARDRGGYGERDVRRSSLRMNTYGSGSGLDNWKDSPRTSRPDNRRKDYPPQKGAAFNSKHDAQRDSFAQDIPRGKAQGQDWRTKSDHQRHERSWELKAPDRKQRGRPYTEEKAYERENRPETPMGQGHRKEDRFNHFSPSGSSHSNRHRLFEKRQLDKSSASFGEGSRGKQLRGRASGASIEELPDTSQIENEKDSQTSQQAKERAERRSSAPIPVPYTTPASEFLYGTSVVMAALKSQRRKMYKLYVYEGEGRQEVARDDAMKKAARLAEVKVQGVSGNHWLRIMDKMSTGRPHNGYILEASPIPKLPTKGLLPVLQSPRHFDVVLGYQSAEEEVVNGSTGEVPVHQQVDWYPLVLFLDGILDPGNLGAIMRTAYFLGVSALAISTRNSAPISTTTLKASAGSSEYLPLLSVDDPDSFINASKKSGWKVYAAVPPAAGVQGRGQGYLTTTTLSNPLPHSPCILMLGGEGEGLLGRLRRKADYEVAIKGARTGAGGVDSLNVAVAAGLVIEPFTRPTALAPSLPRESQKQRVYDQEEDLLSEQLF